MIFLVNTALTAFKRLRPELMAGQLEITRDEHPCLHYDSWLDCAEPHGYDMSSLATAYARDPTTVRGHISDRLRRRIIAVVEASRVIERRKIAWLLAGLHGAPPAK